MQQEAEPRDAPLAIRRPLGMWTLIAITLGLAISQLGLVGVLQGVGIAAGKPLSLIVLAFVCAYLLAISYALSFAELSLMMPSSGGLSTYTEVALGNFPALLATFSGYVVVNIFGIPAELLLFDSVLREVGGLPFPPKVAALSLLLVLAYLNIRGTNVFAALQNGSTVIKVGLMLISGLAIFWAIPEAPAGGIGGPLPAQEAAAGAGFGVMIGLFFWCFVGAEFVCPMIGEVGNPQRAIPGGMLWGLTALAGLYGFYALGARALLPADVLVSSSYPHLEYARSAFGKIGALVLLLTAITATLGLINAVLAGVSRMLQGMAENGQALPCLAARHPRYGSPWVAILALTLTFSIPIVLMGEHPDTIMNLVLAASIAWLIAYVIAHIDLIVLRYRYPQTPRPFRSPGFPLPQLVGIGGMGYVIANSPTEALMLAGYVLGVVGVASALWTRFVMKCGLFAPEALHPDATGRNRRLDDGAAS